MPRGWHFSFFEIGCRGLWGIDSTSKLRRKHGERKHTA